MSSIRAGEKREKEEEERRKKRKGVRRRMRMRVSRTNQRKERNEMIRPFKIQINLGRKFLFATIKKIVFAIEVGEISLHCVGYLIKTPQAT